MAEMTARPMKSSIPSMSVQQERDALAEIRKLGERGRIDPLHILQTIKQPAGQFALCYVWGQHLKRQSKHRQRQLYLKSTKKQEQRDTEHALVWGIGTWGRVLPEHDRFPTFP